MNVYFIGMCISMIIYMIFGIVISRSVKDANDFYVAGRRAPVLLIAGSLIASYTSTGMFMGDAAQCYEGAFAPVIIFAGMQSAGYIIGAIFFGRYLRRSRAFTIPEFFGKRFCSPAVRKLSAVTAIIMMTVYLLSVMQGIGTLMRLVTGVDYNLCIILAMIAFTVLTVTSGSRGVLITDTIMAGLFTGTLVVAIGIISCKSGGWYTAINSIVANPETQQLLSWSGKPGPLYDTGAENMIWGLNYGIVWMSVCMVGPWQSSRYLMAKNEHAIIRSAPISAIGVFLLEFLVGIAAVMIHLHVPTLEDSSHVMIWAAMNLMPKVLGVLLLTGVLSAGISSATTFLSLIGSSFAIDVMEKEGKNSITVGRIAMVIVSVVVLAVALVNPPSIFWIMFLGGAIAACSWMPVAVASIFSKWVTKAGAFAGMLFGTIGCFSLKMYSTIAGFKLPVYLDPSIVGIVCNIIAMVIASAITQVTSQERASQAALCIVPKSELEAQEVSRTVRWMKATMLVGVVVTTIMIALWIIPYYQGLA